MIFQKFDSSDIVAGRVLRVTSGFWPDGSTYATASNFYSNFYNLTQSTSTSPSYGSSIYDIRRTMYYVDVYPDATTRDNDDAYFSIAFGSNVGSGSFNTGRPM